MGSVYKKTFTKPLPANAEVFMSKGETFAKVKPRKGRAVTYPVTIGKDGSQRILVEAETYVAKFRDGAGLIQTVSTGCRDEGAARSVLNDLERRAELVRSGVISAIEDQIADHSSTLLAEHFEAFRIHMQAMGRTAQHVAETISYLHRLADQTNAKRLSDWKRETFDRWLAARRTEGMGARCLNGFRTALVTFANWAVSVGRMVSNPFSSIRKADENADRRRQRRAMTEDELRRLLFVARWRPIAEFGRETVRKDASEVLARRDTWKTVPLSYSNIDAAVERARERLAGNPAFVVTLEHRGRMRALIYKSLVTTGLRKNELASVKLRNLDLNSERPNLILEAENEKNREGNTIPLRADLADDLRSWLAECAVMRKQAAQNAPTIKFGKRRKAQSEVDQGLMLSPDEPLFDVPEALVKILDRDLEAAGIPKRDDRGRTLDVHALRHTFGTHLSLAGVSLRTAQAAMRHSDPKLTANIYTDPRLLDVHGAVEALPTLSLTDTRNGQPETMRATGTDSQLAPMLAPTSRKLVQAVAFPGILADATEAITSTLAFGENTYESNEKASSEGDSDEAFSELPRLDLNQNQLIQSQSCYRYTTGQSADVLDVAAER